MVNQTDSLDSSWVNLGTEGNQETTKYRRCSGDTGIEGEEEFEVLDSKNREMQANLRDTLPEDLSLEDEILANFPGSYGRSLTVESEDEDSYDIIPKNLTLTEIINILNQVVKEDGCKELDEVVQNIEDYEGQSVTLDNESFRDFCLKQLGLDLQNRGDHQHIYSNILLQYSFDQVNSYPAKELVLSAIAANDKLTERYQDILFTERNLSLLPLLVGDERYVKAFMEKFCDTEKPYELYVNLKDQTIQLENGQIGFFPVIALRQERELLNTVLIEYVLRDLEQVLQTSSFNPLYGVLETASLAKNKDFMKIVLDSLERYTYDQAKKDLLKKCIVTFLETAISQEHVSIVEYLCRERINKKDLIIQEIYKEAFADEKIIEQIKNQVLKNIDSAGNGRKEKKQEIYDLILKAALHTGSTDFIIKVLDLIKNDPKFSGDTDRQTFLQNSLVTILDNATRGQHSSIIQSVYTSFISKLAENSEVKFLTIQQKYQNACHTSISVDNSVASQLNEKEPNGDDSSLEQDEFEITDIQEEQRPGVLGLNKTEIAGFSQEKLLEIINFVKIGYYVSDCNLNNKKFSELEKRSYKVPAKLKEEGYKIVQFYNVNDGKQYRHAGYVFIKDNEITIVYRGSRNPFDYMKDTEMILTSSDGLLPEGGKIHSGFYSLFKDSWDSVYEILKGHANDQKLEIKDFKINLTGHSMGGAIANIAALCLSVREGAEDLHVATFASPRVFDSSVAEVYEERLGKKTIRVVNQSDFIPSLPLGSMGYKHVGEQLRISSSSYAHSLDVYRNLIANLEPGQFKSDNSVSIYYYFSYPVTVLYNVLTSPSYLIPNTHSNGDEQYFKQVKNKHKDASLSEMMKYSGSSDEQKALIYEGYESGEDGFITFVMPSLHRHGRSKGLKINPPYIAFFVNNNYLSGKEEFAAQTPPVTLIEDDVAIVSQASTSNDQTTPQQESVVLSIGNSTSRALCVATSDAQQVVPRGGTVSTIEALKNLPNNRTIKIFLLNGQSIAQIFKKSDREAELSLPNGNTYELDLHLINEESLKVLFNKENSVLANAINDFSTVKIPALEQKSGKNEQAPIQLAGHVIREDPIQVVQPKSLVNLEILNEHHSNITANTNDKGVGTTINDQSTSIISSDGRNKQTPILTSPPIVPKKSEELAAQTAQDTSVRDGVTKNDNVVASVSSNDNPSGSSEIRLDESRTGSDQLSNQSTGHITQMDNERAPLSGGNSKLKSNQQDLQPEVLPTVPNGKQSANPNNGGVTVPSVQLDGPESVDKNSGKQDTQPKPPGVPSVANKDSKRVSNAQGNSKHPSYPGQNNPAPRNAKSKLPVIAASMLVITGVATGIAIAVYLEMLAVGIAVGACCLVAAAIIYCCSGPSNSLEKSSAEAVAATIGPPLKP